MRTRRRRRASKDNSVGQLVGFLVVLAVLAAPAEYLRWWSVPIYAAAFVGAPAMGVAVRLRRRRRARTEQAATQARLRQLAARRERERQEAQARRLELLRHIGTMLMLTPTEFEQCVASVLIANGWQQVRVIGGPGDLSADILGTDPNGMTFTVQCKRYDTRQPVGSQVVQTTLGMASLQHRTDRAMIVTTSTFTKPALELARRHGVQLIDGSELVRMAQRLPVIAPGPAKLPVRPGGIRHLALLNCGHKQYVQVEPGVQYQTVHCHQCGSDVGVSKVPLHEWA